MKGTFTVEFDDVKGTAEFNMDLQGTTELEHELLLAAVGSGRGISLIPSHTGDLLSAGFTIADGSMFPAAQRALLNRRRVSDGLPTVEEQEAQEAMNAAQEEDRKKAVAEQQAKDEAAKNSEKSELAASIAASVIEQLKEKK